MRGSFVTLLSVFSFLLFAILFLIPYNYYLVSSGSTIALSDYISVSTPRAPPGFYATRLTLAEYSIPSAFGFTKNTLQIPGWAFFHAAFSRDAQLYKFPEGWKDYPAHDIKQLYLDSFTEDTNYGISKLLDYAVLDSTTTLHIQEGAFSAGNLMLTLEILRQFGVVALPEGKQIAGTGNVHPDGTIVQLGGVEAKLRAAEQTGMTTFIYPASEDLTATTSLELIPVHTIDEAVALFQVYT